ncbi:MAG: histidinol-phosphatase HisJ family protein [Coriobacteriia bacterium]|jgi:histidinol-phosphatase (PHP family)|nr:histidinol-phosphatase HisJ family protein [Coriobacteriia bacterium]
MTRIDLHMHTARCGHGEGAPLDYALAARSAGLDIIAISDHLPLPVTLNPEGHYSMNSSELADYVQDVRDVARMSADRPRVLLGIEADWLPGRFDETQALLAEHPFDVVLGSVHFLDGWAFDDPHLIEEWSRREIVDVWTRYFETFTTAAASGLFDVMAHPDLVKKFGHRPEGDLTRLFEDVAAAIAAAGVAVEISSAGLRYPCAEIYPSEALLRAFCRAGVPVTTGSDAHSPAGVGEGIDVLREAAARAGYRKITYLQAREMREVEL